ncbi:MAG: hypothetical protein HY905_21815 [Deltaproteobacteria bacterium]|nr:hypothetical protein [Deltaproteobacteria bacterium]
MDELTPDLSVRHHHQLPGIPVSDANREDPAVPQLWFWFEDKTGDGHPDLVLETFRYVDDCSHDPVPRPGLTGCEELGPRDEFAPTLEDYPECVRRDDKVELRRAYDPEHDAWRAPSGQSQ